VGDPDTGRVEAFSDGVFAIAATLLVLEIAVRSTARPLGDELLRLWPSYLAYATSFLTIGIMWVNHHACFERIARVDRVLLFVNTALLMCVSFVPFPTRLVAEHLHRSGEGAAALAYGCTLTLTAILFNVLWRRASSGRRLIAADVAQARVDEITRSFRPGAFVYAGGTLLSLASPVASIAVYLALALFYVPSGSLWLKGAS
jgi:uncharacterized membrane protein